MVILGELPDVLEAKRIKFLTYIIQPDDILHSWLHLFLSGCKTLKLHRRGKPPTCGGPVILILSSKIYQNILKLIL